MQYARSGNSNIVPNYRFVSGGLVGIRNPKGRHNHPFGLYLPKTIQGKLSGKDIAILKQYTDYNRAFQVTTAGIVFEVYPLKATSNLEELTKEKFSTELRWAVRH